MGRKMKDSGVEWIGEIPMDWNTIPIKYLVTYNDDTLGENKDDDFEFDYVEIGSVEYGKGILRKERLKFYSAPSRARRIVREKDIIISTVRTYLKAVAKINNLDYPTIVSTGFAVLRPVNYKVYSDYLGYAVQSTSFVSAVESHSVGISYPAINASELVKLKIACPNILMQKKISQYLNKKCNEIDLAIKNTKKSIESYKSLKQSLITRAVTKGVRGKREMKDSRVKRWGMIPNNWDFVRLKYCITNVSSGLSAVTDDDTSGESGKFVLRTSAVSTGIFIPSEVKAVLKSAEVRLKCPVEGNTLIVSRMNTSNMVGSCAYVDRDYENIFLPDKLWKIHLKKEYNVKFFWYAINSIPARAYYSEISTGASASMQNITMADFGNNKIALPPIDEQDCIASYLDEKCTAIDTLIAKKEQLLTELEAYKKSLIYEYVTGKR